ncbi:MAG: hypothetical protein IPN31_16470 [Bacteroidetes bacterium]|nr:hypothetical protein [Bacteroidota bacterium]
MLDAYSGASELWQQGIATGLMAPQFHGREHLNLSVSSKIKNKDADILAALKTILHLNKYKRLK